MAVRVETVAPLAPLNGPRYSGTVRAQSQVEVAFRTGGYVDSIAMVRAPRAGAARSAGDLRPLQAGDPVHPGMVLASLRQGDYRQRVSEANAMSNEASASRRNAMGDFKRARRLLAKGAISRAEYDTTKARFAVLNGSVVAAAARAGQTRLVLRDTQLRSPLDGIVLDRTLEVGVLVAPGAPAFVVADTSVVRVSFAVSDSVQRTLSLGRRMVATTSAAPERVFTGTIDKIAAQADPKTRTFDVEVSVDNPELILKVGMIASVQAEAQVDDAAAIGVPLGAVVQDADNSGHFMVYVVTDDQGASLAHARAVELGSFAGNRVMVSAGIEVGERVIVQGATLVTDGARVNVIPPRGGPPVADGRSTATAATPAVTAL